MIVAVSDLHLGDKASNKAGFVSFIEEYLKPNAEDITHLFLLGDILDLWRRDNSAVILNNYDILDSIRSLGFRVFYLVGNHDFIMTEMIGKYPGLVPPASHDTNPGDITVCTTHQLINGKRKFRFIHGHQIDYWYALPFYKVFCKAMCSVDEYHNAITNIWDLVLKLSKDTSPIVSSRIPHLSDETRRKIVKKLAGPLEGNAMSKEESILVELDLLHQFIEISHLCTSHNDTDTFDSIRKEVQQLSDNSRKRRLKINSIEELSNVALSGSSEEVVNRFLMSWSDIHQWFLETEKKRMNLENRVQLVRHFERVAAMLTVNLQPDEILIHGHGHLGYIDEEIGVADTGCWLFDKAAYITIEEGVVKLLKQL